MFDPVTATWHLKDSNSAGAPSQAPFAFGTAACQPVVGDWDGPPLALRAAADPADPLGEPLGAGEGLTAALDQVFDRTSY